MGGAERCGKEVTRPAHTMLLPAPAVPLRAQNLLLSRNARTLSCLIHLVAVATRAEGGMVGRAMKTNEAETRDELGQRRSSSYRPRSIQPQARNA
jgi:hypothetical protein